MRKRHTLLIFLILGTVTISAQQKIDGLVEDHETGEPVSYASVVPVRGDIIVTDSLGKFSLPIRKNPRPTDSILISAIGYLSKKIAVKDLLADKRIKLNLEERILGQVKIFASLKGDERKFGYFREWKVKSNGGEIGYIFEMPERRFQIGQVQAKINHNYDTCWLKLHLRNVAKSGFNEPRSEIAHKETILPATTRNGLVEFDLDWEEITISSNKLYVGFELVKCGCSESSAPSFFFMGNEEGTNYYTESGTQTSPSNKSRRKNGMNTANNREPAVWQQGVDYTIYVRMTTK